MSTGQASPEPLLGRPAEDAVRRAPVFIGVDGGATKTHIIAREHDNALALDLTLPGCSYTVLGPERFRAALTEVRTSTLAALHGPERIMWAIGIPGYGDNAERSRQIENAVAATFREDHYQLYNDIELAHAGALRGGPGVVVAAGTGSIALAIDEGRRHARAGGLGPPLGDVGSSHAIGVAALRRLARRTDREFRQGGLADGLLRAAHTRYLSETARLLDAEAEKRVEVAALASIVDQAAERGDTNAKELLADAGAGLAYLAQEAVHALAMSQATEISYAGGTFKSHTVRQSFARALHNAGYGQVHAPADPPADGGVLLARRQES